METSAADDSEEEDEEGGLDEADLLGGDSDLASHKSSVGIVAESGVDSGGVDEEEGEEGFPPLLMALTIELVAANEARMAGEVGIKVPLEVVA